MSGRDIDRATALCPNVKSVICAAFPYFASRDDGNIAKYARGRDYHKVVVERLSRVCEELKKEYHGGTFVPLTDASPIPEVRAALMAGVGILGLNGLLAVPPYGAFVFLGEILTDVSLPYTAVDEIKLCSKCMLCVSSCPGNAIDPKTATINTDLCLSNLTQKNGDIPDFASGYIASSGYVWGCDICIDVCPMNANPKRTDIKDFSENLITRLRLEDIKNTTRRGFCERFPERAFTFRGPAPIIRNLKLKDKGNE